MCNAADLISKTKFRFEIENGLHWYLDMVFHEDAMALTDRNVALNQSILNKACLLSTRGWTLRGGRKRSARID